MSKASTFRRLKAVASVAVAVAVAALVLPALASAQTPDCGTILQYALSPDTPPFTAGVPTGEVLATDNYVYVLTTWGFLRSSIFAPAAPGVPQLLQVANLGNNGGKVSFFCDCHQGGSTFDVAEGPGGDSRLISDFLPGQVGSLQPCGASPLPACQPLPMPAQAGRGIGGAFTFGQQVNVAVRGGSQVAAIYIGAKYYSYVSDPNANAVKLVDLTNLTGLADSICNPNCSNNPASAVQATAWPGLTLWTATSLVARQVQLSGQTRFLLVGTKGTQLAVAQIDPATGQAMEKYAFATASDVARLDVANVNGRTFIFSAENSLGLRVYELTESGGAYSVAPVPQPAAFQGTVTRVVVRGAPGSPTPFIFIDKTSPCPSFPPVGPMGSCIQIYDSGWLTLGTLPRLGKRLLHIGKSLSAGRHIVNIISFGARVPSASSPTTAYVYELAQDIVANPSDPVLVVVATPVDITCIAADPTAPAVASLLPVNKSAAQRAGAEAVKNYYGDRWEMRDTTATGVPLIRLEWDLNVPAPYGTAQYAPDPPPWAMTSDGAVPLTLSILNGNPAGPPGTGIFWPCDPAAAGDPVNGAGCNVSVGGSVSGGSYALGIRTKNTNPLAGPIPSTYVNAAAPVLAPLARIVCPPGDTVCQGGGPLTMLSGDRIDASASDGNILDGNATIAWSFVGCSPSCPGGFTGVNPVVPTGANGFTLTITYGDRYVATKIGNISQRDLVASFTLSPTSVLRATPFTLTNTMRTLSATVTQVSYAVKDSGGATVSSGNLPASFFPINGTASLTAPSTLGNYTVELTYTFNGPSGSGQTQGPISQPFSVVDWTPVPSVNVFTDAPGTSPVTFFPPPTVIVNTTYYIKDVEQVPNGIVYPGAIYYLSANSSPSVTGDTALGSRLDQSTWAWVPSTLGTFYLKAVVQGVVSSGTQVVVSTAQPFSVQISGASSGTIGSPITFAAIASGGTPPYSSYQWDCDFAIVPNYSSGGTTQQCTYSTNGAHVVLVKVTDSASSQATSQWTVTIGGGGGGLSVTLTASPASPQRGAPVTFTAAASGGTGVYSYRWKQGEAQPSFELWIPTGSTPTFTYTYVVGGVYTASCETTSGASVLVTTKTITVIGTAGPSAAFTVSGATANPGGGYTVETGRTVTFGALEVPSNVSANGYAWDFGDLSTASGRVVTHIFQTTGSRTVRLTVTGDGTNRAGTATSTAAFTIVPVSFQAMLVPSAEHSAVLTDPNGILKFWATDVSVANPGSAPVTISPAFLSFTATQGLTFDLSIITFDPSLKVTIPAGGQRSWVDMVKTLAGDVANKGTLVLKYEGGNAMPLVTARVYFAPAADPLGPASGSALPSFRATSDGQVVTQGTQVATEQALPDLRGDASYYFRLTLFNSASTGGTFRVSAVDDRGVPVTLLDPRTGNFASGGVDFAIGPYQAVDWSNDSFGMNDPARRYVVKARRTSSTGRLIASAAVRDRLTRDQVLVTSEPPPEFKENCVGSPGQCVNYVVPGASRFQSSTGAHWRTGLSIFNSSLSRRGVSLEYRYQDTALATPERVASGFVFMDPGQLVFYDDVVAQVFASAGNNLADPDNGTAGVLRITHYVDGDTSTAPLIISARNYDDQPTGTVGSQLSVYTRPLSLGPNEPSLRLAGPQADGGGNPKPRFETILSAFSFDDTQTTVRLTAVKSDGTVLGFHDLVLNQPGAGGHFQPRNLNIPEFNAVVNEPITIKVDVMSGGRVGAYALIRDIVTRDPTYVQAVPQN